MLSRSPIQPITRPVMARRKLPTVMQRAIAILRRKASSPAGIFVAGSGYLQTPGNLLTWSNDLTNAAWAVLGAGSPSVTANSYAGPDGSMTADSFTIDAGHIALKQQPAGTFTVGATYTFAAWVRAADTSPAANARVTTNNTSGWNTGGSTKVALTSSWQLVVTSWTQTATTTEYLMIGAYDVAGASDATCYGGMVVAAAGFFQGTYTSSQLLAMGGIPLSTSAAVAAVYTDAHVYLPGANGAVISALNSGNYLLSDGSSGFSPTDGLQGLVLDGMGAVGAELNTNPGGPFTTTTGYTATGGGAIAVVSGDIELTASGGAFSGIRRQYTTEVGKTYRVTVVGRRGTTASNIRITTIAGNVDSASTTNTTLTATFTATGTTSGVDLLIVSGTATGTAYLASESFVEISGIHATSSGAARPTLRRGAYNLLTYSQNLNQWAALTRSSCSGGAINATTAPDGTLTGDKLVEDATATSTHYARNSIVKAAVATTYTYSVYLKAAERTWAQISIGHDASPLLANVYINLSTGALGASAISTFTGLSVATPVDAGNGWWRCAITATTGVELSANGNVLLATGNNGNTFSGDGTSGIYVWGAQLEVGSTASDYTPTTTAAASNPLAGRYSSQYSGAQSLTLGSVPFVMADDSCTIAAGKIDGVPGGAKAPYLAAVKGNSFTTVSGLAFDNTGRPLGQWYDGTTAAAITHGSVVLTTVVMSARKIGDSKVLRVNGVQSGSANTTVLANTAVTNAYIGDSSGAVGATLVSASYALNGSIGPAIFIKGTITDSDLLTLERFVASLTPNGPSF